MTRSLRAPEEPVEVEPAPDGAPEGLDRFRIVLAAAMGTVLVSYAMLVPPALLVVLAGGGDGSVDGAFAAAIPLWLAAHLIPLELQGRPLSVLPLLPTLGVLVVTSVGARWAVRRLGARFRHDAGPVIAAVAGGHAAVAVLGSALLPSSAQVGAAPWAAMLGAGLVAGLGAAIGVLPACGLPPAWRERLRGWPAAGLAGAAVAGAGLLFVGALALVVGLVFGAGRAHGMYEALTPTGGGALGLTLLSIAYLPNAVVGGASWLLGPGVDVGLGAWTPFGGAPGELPPFPLFAALPTVRSPGWAVAVVVVPVVLGLIVGGICRTALGPTATGPDRLRAVGVAAGAAAVASAVVALVVGGRLSGGDFDPVSVPAGYVLLAVAVWIGGPAAVVALVQRGGAPPVAEDGELEWYRDGYVADHEPVETPADRAPGQADEEEDGADDRGDGRRAASPAAAGSRGDTAPARAGADHAGADPARADPADAGPAGGDSAGSDSAGSHSAGSHSAGSDSAGSDAAGADCAGADCAGADCAGADCAGADCAGADCADADRADAEPADAEQAANAEAAGAARVATDRPVPGSSTTPGASDRDSPADPSEDDPSEDDASAVPPRRSLGSPRRRDKARRPGRDRGDRPTVVDAARRRRELRLGRAGATDPAAGGQGLPPVVSGSATPPEEDRPTRRRSRSPRDRQPDRRDERETRPTALARVEPTPVESEPPPRTVAELVALRRRQEAERGAQSADPEV
jgi:hypothetical protein